MKQRNYSLSMFWNKRDVDDKTKEAPISLTVNLPRKQFRVSLKYMQQKLTFIKLLHHLECQRKKSSSSGSQ